jgi:hypothetical protein
MKPPSPCAKPKNAAVQARELVAAYTSAGSASSRQTALIALLHAMKIGVYNSDTGAPLESGVEASPKDYYLYDYEVTLLDDAMQRNELRSLDVPAGVLTNVGISPGGHPVDPGFLQRVLEAAVQGAVAHPTTAGEIVPLVIRELGLHHEQPYDLATAVPESQIQLDPLQTEILIADVLGKMIHTAAHSGAFVDAMVPRLPGPCKAINLATSPFNPNTYLDLFGIHLHYVGDAGLAGQISDFVQALSLAEKTVGTVNLVYTALSGLHGMLLAYSIKIDSLPDLHPSTHYGPAGSTHEADAGKPMTFRTQVTMQDKLPENVRTCINDAGFSVPKKGPVANVGISWDIQGDLEKYGTVTFSPSDEKTGPDGIETMVFFPHNEKFPGFGTLYTKVGSAAPRALWGQAFENLLATVNQVVTPKLGPEFGWVVSYHKPRGFAFSNLTWSVHDNVGEGFPDSTSTFTVSGSVCGDDPNALWILQVHEVSNWPVFGHHQYDGTYEVPWVPGHPMATQGNLGDQKTLGSLTPGLSPQIALRVTTSGEQAGPADQTVTATVHDDMSCPDNSDD